MKRITLARQIGLVVRRQRQSLKMTQQQLADAAEVSRGFISRLEKGVSVAVYPEKLLDVLRVLGLSLWVGGGDEVQGVCDDVSGAEKRSGASRVDEEADRFGGNVVGTGNGELCERVGHGSGSKSCRSGKGNSEIATLQIDASLLKPFDSSQRTQVGVRGDWEPEKAQGGTGR